MGIDMAEREIAIHESLAKYGAKVPKPGLERRCANCAFYEILIEGNGHSSGLCNNGLEYAEGENRNVDDTDGDICWNHATEDEIGLLRDLATRAMKSAEEKRVETERKNGTGQCSGCRFRAFDILLEQLRQREGVWCPGIHSSGHRGWVASCRMPTRHKQHLCAGSWLKAWADTPEDALKLLVQEIDEWEKQK